MSQLAGMSGAEEADARHRLGVRRATLLAASLAFFVTLLDTSIVNLALVPMQDALGAYLAGLQYVVYLYALAFASFLPTGGALADKFGVQGLFLLVHGQRERVSAAERVCDCDEDVQCPNERNPIIFMQAVY